MIDKTRCHQVYEARADHLKENDHPFLLREDRRLATIVSSLAVPSQKFRVILKQLEHALGRVRKLATFKDSQDLSVYLLFN